VLFKIQFRQLVGGIVQPRQNVDHDP
jgi:hypothetical protein